MLNWFRLLQFTLVKIEVEIHVCRNFFSTKAMIGEFHQICTDKPNTRDVIEVAPKMHKDSVGSKIIPASAFVPELRLDSAVKNKESNQQISVKSSDALILFSPSIKRCGGSLDVVVVSIFVDSDHDLIVTKMYYKKCLEFMKLVEEFYRAYRALTKRYDHATRALRQAHHTIVEVFPNQVPLILTDDSPSGLSNTDIEPYTPEMSHFDTDDLSYKRTYLGASSTSASGSMLDLIFSTTSTVLLRCLRS
ncbi:hypothetical protein GIB67_014558, partial [Kingdonia uniflora]